MSNTNNFVFTALKIVAWVFFMGLYIDAGGLIVNFFIGFYKPELVASLYQKLDLSALYHHSKWAYFGMYSFILAIAILKAVLFYVVIKLVSQIDLSKPFSPFVSTQVFLISYYTFSIGLVSYIARATTRNLQHRGFATDNLNPFWADSRAFILMAAVVYVIAAIFKKGLEMQAENELTV